MEILGNGNRVLLLPIALCALLWAYIWYLLQEQLERTVINLLERDLVDGIPIQASPSSEDHKVKAQIITVFS